MAINDVFSAVEGDHFQLLKYISTTCVYVVKIAIIIVCMKSEELTAYDTTLDKGERIFYHDYSIGIQDIFVNYRDMSARTIQQDTISKAH